LVQNVPKGPLTVYDSIRNDDPARELVLEETAKWTIREMSTADWESLLEELGLIAFGSKEALEAAELGLDASFVEDCSHASR
jgi:hypothetical protein